MNWRTGYIVFASLLAAFGFGWSILWLILRYTQFMTVSRVHLTTAESAGLPTLSVCHTFSPAMENATIAEIWKTFPAEKEVIDTEKSFVLSSTADKLKVKKYLMDRYICYSISPGDQIRWMQESDISSLPAVMASIAFKPGINVNGDKHSVIFMHDDPLPERLSPHVLGPKNGVTSLTYGSQESLLLPRPYETNCRVYEEGDEHSSRSDCVNKCKRQGSSNLVPADLLVDEPLDLVRDLSANGSKINRHKCESICLRDCVVRRFWPRVLSTEESEESRINLMYPMEANIRETFLPTLTLAELMTDVIELLIFWTVVSPLPFIMMEKTILSIMRSEDELKTQRNGVRPYAEPVAPRTQRSAGSAGHRNNNKNISENKVISNSFSLENEENAT